MHALPLSQADAYAQEELIYDEKGQVLEEKRLRSGERHLGGSHAPGHSPRLAQRRQRDVLRFVGLSRDDRGHSGTRADLRILTTPSGYEEEHAAARRVSTSCDT